MNVSIRSDFNVGQQLAVAAQKCRDALAEPKFAALTEVAKGVPSAPVDSEGWFELLGRYRRDSEADQIIGRFKAAAITAGGGDESKGLDACQYAAVQAVISAAPRAAALPLSNSVKRQYALFCVEIAAGEKQWRQHFDTGAHFNTLALNASLRNFPVGELEFSFTRFLWPTWPLMIPPRALPGFMAHVLTGLRGIGPFVGCHINYGRKNGLILNSDEAARSLWRMAKTVEGRPEVKGMVVPSWFLSPGMTEIAPNLVWFRSLMAEGGAYLVDLRPEVPSTFSLNSRKRQRMWEEGLIWPRRTLALWARDDFLAWAARHPELADPCDGPVAAPVNKWWRIKVKSPRPARVGGHNSRFPLWNGLDMLEWRTMRYMLRVLAAPTGAAAVVAFALFGFAASIVAAVGAFTAMWIIQYYFFQ